MTDYCLFTLTHPEARRIYIRGIADITEPIDEFEKIIQFYDENELANHLPANPYEKGSEDFRLFEELLETIKSHFEDLGVELIFASEEEKSWRYCNPWNNELYDINMKKVVID